MGVGIARLPTLPASRSSIALIVCPPHACLSLRGFDQQLDANDIAREDATPIQRSGEPHPEGLPIDVGDRRARGAGLTGPPRRTDPYGRGYI